MPEEKAFEAHVFAGSFDEFVVLVTQRGNGMLEVVCAPGMTKPVLVAAGGSATVTLRMPALQGAPQTVPLTIVRDAP